MQCHNRDYIGDTSLGETTKGISDRPEGPEANKQQQGRWKKWWLMVHLKEQFARSPKLLIKRPFLSLTCTSSLVGYFHPGKGACEDGRYCWQYHVQQKLSSDDPPSYCFFPSSRSWHPDTSAPSPLPELNHCEPSFRPLLRGPHQAVDDSEALQLYCSTPKP